MVSTIAFVSVTTGLDVFMMWQCGIFPSASSFNTVGMRLLSYNMTTDQYVNTTITRFVTVVAYNQMVISTSTGKPLVVDQNPVQKVYAQLPDGLVTLSPTFNTRTLASIPCTTFTLQHRETISPTATWIHSKTGHISNFPGKTSLFGILLYLG